MFIAQVGKPPNVPQPDCIPHAGQEEVTLVVPATPLHLLLLLFCLRTHYFSLQIQCEVHWCHFQTECNDDKELSIRLKFHQTLESSALSLFIGPEY